MKQILFRGKRKDYQLKRGNELQKFIREMKEQIECLKEENKNLRECIDSIRKPKPPNKN